jgi:antitoxin ParD1/3/4
VAVADLAKFCQKSIKGFMTTMNISLPEKLKAYVDAQVTGRRYGTSSEYVRELIRKDQDRQHLRELLLEGAASAPGAPADAAWFDDLRARAGKRAAE